MGSGFGGWVGVERCACSSTAARSSSALGTRLGLGGEVLLASTPLVRIRVRDRIG